MASQASQSSQDLKDEPGNVKLVDILKQLAVEYEKEVANKDSKEAKELYEGKFVPWIKKAVRCGDVIPGKCEQIHVTHIIGNGQVRKVTWEKMRELAAKDDIRVGSLEDDSHDSWTVSIAFDVQ